MTLTEVLDVTGTEGDFSVELRHNPRFVDMDKCIACGQCSEKCPRQTDNEYDAGIVKRKAIYFSYSQAVPLKYQIDPNTCIRVKKSAACCLCEKICPAQAINFSEKPVLRSIEVGSVILATGFKHFDPTGTGVWGYGKYPNVITSIQLERYLSATGPTSGKLLRPSDHKPVRTIAFLQCVGSRDQKSCNNEYCSSICCMSTIKEAMIAQDLMPGLKTTVFFMDMRASGKEFDRYYEDAKRVAGVRFIRSRVHGVEYQDSRSELRIHYIDKEGKQAEEFFDLVVLAVGIESQESMVRFAEKISVGLTPDRFAATSDFMPVLTSRKGIFTCGAFASPKDITRSVTDGSAAAAGAAQILSSARYTLISEKQYPPEKDTSADEPRVGVFVCHCGTNISSVVDVEAVAGYVEQLPGVKHVERKLFACSQDSQDLMVEQIVEKKLNRVVVASCSPRTHEPLFRETLKSAGINQYLFEMANLRNQNAWVHFDTPQKATQKAKDLIRMAVAKVLPQKALQPVSVSITQSALVVGAGLAGITSALSLADQGFRVFLLEKSNILGGNALYLRKTWKGEHVPRRLQILIDKVLNHPNITLFTNTVVKDVEGHVGNFQTTVSADGMEQVLKHGVSIIATGGRRLKPKEYGYGIYDQVLASIEFDKLHEVNAVQVRSANNFVFIQCVGSRNSERPYCSRVCCTHTILAAIDLKKKNPGRNVYVLYRDIRTYGQRERLYTKARELGIVFINYELYGKPVVTQCEKALQVTVWDHVLHQPLLIKADLVILATAVLPAKGVEELARMFHVSLNKDGFFQEAHAKLRPVDCATDGVFIAGLSQYPKPVEESISQALAAASRSATLLSKKEIMLDPVKAYVDEKLCDGCALCIDICPYQAIALVEKVDESGRELKSITINMTRCEGCGLCQGTCPKRGVSVAGFTLDQINRQVAAALGGIFDEF
jgi:heterodisulfide reductase subunit A